MLLPLLVIVSWCLAATALSISSAPSPPTPKPSASVTTTTSRADTGGDVTARDYLARIGFAPDEAEDIISSASTDDSAATLQRILSAHLLTVPFENMDQHDHPADNGAPPSPAGSSHDRARAAFVPRKRPEGLPSLRGLDRTLEKIVRHRRGGFCFELNFAFGWLLRSLGYSVRYALADVGCDQAVPAHVVVLVDGLVLPCANVAASPVTDATTVLVDVGFGTPGVCEVMLPLELNQPRTNPFGDVFRFDAARPGHPRFDTTLYRTRVRTRPHEEEPMYRFHAADDLPMAADEFEEGLHRVLHHSPTFNGKRLCVLSTAAGHVTLGADYIKWVEQGGAVVRRMELPTENLWREALELYFGVALCAD